MWVEPAAGRWGRLGWTRGARAGSQVARPIGQGIGAATRLSAHWRRCGCRAGGCAGWRWRWWRTAVGGMEGWWWRRRVDPATARRRSRRWCGLVDGSRKEAARRRLSRCCSGGTGGACGGEGPDLGSSWAGSGQRRARIPSDGAWILRAAAARVLLVFVGIRVS